MSFTFHKLAREEFDLAIEPVKTESAFLPSHTPAESLITGAVENRSSLYTLNRKLMISPSFTMYSLPSIRNTPRFLASTRLPHSTRSL